MAKPEEKSRNEEDESREKDSGEVEKALAREKEREEIELMDYVNFPVEEFIFEENEKYIMVNYLQRWR